MFWKTLVGIGIAFAVGVEYARRHSLDPWGDLHESLKRAGKRMKDTFAFDNNTGETELTHTSIPVTNEGASENGQEQRDQQQDNLRQH